MIERDYRADPTRGCVDFDPEHSLIALIRRDMTGDRAAAGNTDRSISLAGDGKTSVGIRRNASAGEEVAHHLNRRPFLGEG